MTKAKAKIIEIEFGTNRALAYAILASEAPNVYLMSYRFLKVLVELEKFISILTPDYLKSLMDSQRRRLFLRMQDTHMILARFLRSPEAASIVRFPVLGNTVGRLRERADDLNDIVEGILLAEDSHAKALLAAFEACIEAHRRPHLPQNEIDRELLFQFEQLCKQWRLTDPGFGSDLERLVQGISRCRVPHWVRRVESSAHLELCLYRAAGKNLQKYDWRIIGLAEKTSATIYPVAVYRKRVGSDVNQVLLEELLADALRRVCLGPAPCGGSEDGEGPGFVDQSEKTNVCEVM
jgi:hypothetical protein